MELNLMLVEAVVVASCAIFLLGVVWYSPLFFGQFIVKSLGITRKELKQQQTSIRKKYVLNLTGILLTTVGLAVMQSMVNVSSLLEAGTLSLAAWLFFVVPVQFSAWLFSRNQATLLFIDLSYQFLAYQIVGIILIVASKLI